MAFSRVAALLHAALSDVVATQHHTATVAGDLNLADLAARAHADLSDSPADAHHAQAHTPESHTNQGATAAELETLTDTSDADALHKHPIHARIATGEYTGDGATSQAITGIGFQVKFVRITKKLGAVAAFAAQENEWTTDVIVDDDATGGSISEATDSFEEFGDDHIIALGVDGFTVDDNALDQDPNENLTVYNFMAIGV